MRVVLRGASLSRGAHGPDILRTDPDSTNMSDATWELYNVVGVKPDGSREIVESAFPLSDAEQCRELMERISTFASVVIERAEEFGKPPLLYRLIGLRGNGEWMIVHEGVPLAVAEREQRSLLAAGSVVRVAIEPVTLPGSESIDPRD